jgi:uncharacterized membrane protein YdjX (TVP38/TMEM64 family)
MTFLEPIIAAAIGAALTFVAVRLNKNKVAQSVLKHGPLIQKAYNVIDPVLDKNLHKWQGSQVDRAFELVVESIGDSKLSPEEVKTISFYLAKNYLPQKAADKVRQYEAASKVIPQLTAATVVASHVNNVIGKAEAVSKIKNILS